MKYRLYMNGRLAARGPVDIGTDYAGGSTERWFYDYRDLTQLMHKGGQRDRRRGLPALADRVHRLPRAVRA